MKNISLLLFFAALITIGCHKKDGAAVATESANTSPTAATEATTAVGTDPAKPLPPPPSYIAAKADNIVHQNTTGQMDPFLSDQLRIFVKQKGRMPASFTEFANTRLDSIPRPPKGEKWVIDATAVQVKAVAINQ